MKGLTKVANMSHLSEGLGKDVQLAPPSLDPHDFLCLPICFLERRVFSPEFSHIVDFIENLSWQTVI